MLEILCLATSNTVISIFHLSRIIGAKRHSTCIFLRAEGENEVSTLGGREVQRGMEEVSAGRSRTKFAGVCIFL